MKKGNFLICVLVVLVMFLVVGESVFAQAATKSISVQKPKKSVFNANLDAIEERNMEAIFTYYSLENRERINHLIKKILDIDWDESQWGPPTLAQLRGMAVDEQKLQTLIFALIDDMLFELRSMRQVLDSMGLDVKEILSLLKANGGVIGLDQLKEENQKLYQKIFDKIKIDFNEKLLAILEKQVEKDKAWQDSQEELIRVVGDVLDDALTKTFAEISEDSKLIGGAIESLENAKKQYQALPKDKTESGSNDKVKEPGVVVFLRGGGCGFVGSAPFSITKWLNDEENQLQGQFGCEFGLGVLLGQVIFIQGSGGATGEKTQGHFVAEAGLNLAGFKIGGGAMHFQDKIKPVIYASSGNRLNLFVRFQPSKKVRFIQVGLTAKIDI